MRDEWVRLCLSEDPAHHIKVLRSEVDLWTSGYVTGPTWRELV